EQTRGEGDAIASETYATAYNQNADFYAFYRSLNAYKVTFNDRRDILLLEPKSDFFNFFNNLNGRTPVEVENKQIAIVPQTIEETID
ncbi:MAG: hypothetical protein KAI17_01105, partial [Thiotrichaceae bacterium]|nr:hypothetical protein [Thiotrichaceae bacterium]